MKKDMYAKWLLNRGMWLWILHKSYCLTTVSDDS
jgi:hypothetical protein